MRQYIRNRRSVMVLSSVALIALSACGGDKGDSAALPGDSTLGRDLAMAQQDSLAQPQLQDVPPVEPAPVAAPAPTPRPAPARPAPRPRPAPAPAAVTPAPAPALPVTGTIAAGSTLRFASNTKVCTNSTSVGEKFTAALDETVTGTNGVSIPAGASGTFEVVEAKSAKNSNDATTLRVRLIAVTYNGNTYPVEATVQTAATTRVRSASTGTDAKKVAGGAILGAIAGQIIGKNTKGTVIGAAAGAAAGTAAASTTADFDTCLNNGGSVVVTLDAPATVRLPLAP